MLACWVIFEEWRSSHCDLSCFIKSDIGLGCYDKNCYLYDEFNYRTMKRFINYIAAIMLLGVVSCGEEKDASDVVLPEFEPFELSVQAEGCRVEICYQRISNIDNNPIWADIERQNYANSFRGYTLEPMDVEASAEMLVEEYNKEGKQNLQYSVAGYSYTMDQSVHYTRDNTILCYETFIETNTGGVHSSYGLWYECFDLATGQLYDFSYLFEDEWGDAMRELAFERLIDVHPTTFIESAADMPMARSVLITEEGIAFVYQTYAVASYVDGIITLEFTDAEIAATGAPLVWVD